MYFLRAVTFPEKLILRSQLHDKYVRKDSSLTIIHSFKVTMSWTIFKISQFFIVESSRVYYCQQYALQMWLFKIFEYLHRRGCNIRCFIYYLLSCHDLWNYLLVVAHLQVAVFCIAFVYCRRCSYIRNCCTVCGKKILGTAQNGLS